MWYLITVNLKQNARINYSTSYTHVQFNQTPNNTMRFKEPWFSNLENKFPYSYKKHLFIFYLQTVRFPSPQSSKHAVFLISILLSPHLWPGSPEWSFSFRFPSDNDLLKQERNTFGDEILLEKRDHFS